MLLRAEPAPHVGLFRGSLRRVQDEGAVLDHEFAIGARKPRKVKSPIREFTISAWWAMLVRWPVPAERRPHGPRRAGRSPSARTSSWAFVRQQRWRSEDGSPRVDYFDDPEASAAKSPVPSVNVAAREPPARARRRLRRPTRGGASFSSPPLLLPDSADRRPPWPWPPRAPSGSWPSPYRDARAQGGDPSAVVRLVGEQRQHGERHAGGERLSSVPEPA